METAVEKVAHAYFIALVEGKIDDWVNLFADDAVSNDPVGSPHRGKSELREFLTQFVAHFKSIALYEREILSVGDNAAVKWEGIGEGLNGQSVTFYGIDVISINKAGKIQTVYAFWDPTPVLKAVGAA
jgi:ketosteroid isomerase-like protein